ncbi:MAG: hypothetical protein WC661_19315 [Opitutaceae bacterium]|jgi:hypothetical protein
MHAFLRTLSLLLLAVPCVGSSQTSAPADKKEDVVAVKFGLYAWKGDIPPLHYGSKRKVEAIEAYTRSSIQNYTGPAQLNFTLAPPTPSPKPDTPPPVVASVSIPAGVTRVTLLTAQNRQGGYQIFTIPEDGDDFHEGSVRIYNVTPQRLRIVHGNNQRLELASGASGLIKTTGDAVLLRVGRLVNDRWREVINNVATLNHDGRQNVLLVPGDNGQGVGLYTLPPWSSRPNTPDAPSTPAS